MRYEALIGGALALGVLLLSGCDRQTPATPDGATGAPSALVATPGGACAPLDARPVRLSCVKLSDRDKQRKPLIFRGEEDLKAHLAPDCEGAMDAINWDEVSVIGVGLMASGCSVQTSTAVCLEGQQAKVSVGVELIGTCEMMIQEDILVSVPKLAPSITATLSLDERQRPDASK